MVEKLEMSSEVTLKRSHEDDDDGTKSGSPSKWCVIFNFHLTL